MMLSSWSSPAGSEVEEMAQRCGAVRPRAFDVKERCGARPLLGLRERSRSPLNVTAESHHAAGRPDWTQGHATSSKCGAHKPGGSVQEICHHHLCLRKRFEELKQRYEQEKLLWVKEKEVLLREVAEIHAVENRRLLLELRQQLEELRLDLRGAEQRRGELSGRYHSDKTAWDAERAELRGRLTQLEARTDSPLADGACGAKERDGPERPPSQLERDEQRRLLADTHGAALDLRRQLQGSERRWERERRDLAERLERERRDWQLQLRRMQRRVEQLQRDIRLRDSGFGDSFSPSRPDPPAKSPLEDVPEAEAGDESTSGRPPRGREVAAGASGTAPGTPGAREREAEALLDALVSDVLRDLEATAPAEEDDAARGGDEGEGARSSCLNEALCEITRVSQELCGYQDEVRRKARPPRPKSATATLEQGSCEGSWQPARAQSTASLLHLPSASSKRRPSETNKRRNNWCNSLDLDSIAESPPMPGTGEPRHLRVGAPPVPPRTTSWPPSPSDNSSSSGDLATTFGGAEPDGLSGKCGPVRASAPAISQNATVPPVNELNGPRVRWSCDLSKIQQAELEASFGTEARAASRPPAISAGAEGRRTVSETRVSDTRSAALTEFGGDAAFRRMVAEHKSAIVNARRAAANPTRGAFAGAASREESDDAAGPTAKERGDITTAVAWSTRRGEGEGTSSGAAWHGGVGGSRNTYVKIIDFSKFYRSGDGKKSAGATASPKGNRGQSLPELFSASCKQRLLSLQQKNKARSETNADWHAHPRNSLRHVAGDVALFQRGTPTSGGAVSLPGQLEGGVRLAGRATSPGDGGRAGRATARPRAAESRSNFGVIRRILGSAPDGVAWVCGAEGEPGGEREPAKPIAVGKQPGPANRAPVPDSHGEQRWQRWQLAAPGTAQPLTSVAVTYPAPSLESNFPRPARPCRQRPPSRWAPRPVSAPPGPDAAQPGDPQAPAVPAAPGPPHRIDDPLLVLEILLEDSSQVWRSHRSPGARGGTAPNPWGPPRRVWEVASGSRGTATAATGTALRTPCPRASATAPGHNAHVARAASANPTGAQQQRRQLLGAASRDGNVKQRRRLDASPLTQPPQAATQEQE
ncbi:unnamed protein product [Lampetra planeri]